MEGSPLALSIFAISGTASFLTIWRWTRHRTLLSFLLPPVFLVTLFFAAFKFGERFATCTAPDCGPLMFVAIGLFAITMALSGFAGSIAGVVAGHVLVDRRKGRLVIAAIVISFAVLVAHRILFSLFTGQPLEVGYQLAAFEMLFTAIPFLALAVTGRRTRLPWVLGIAATVCLWAWNLCVATGLFDDDAWIGPMGMSLLVTALVLLADRYRSGRTAQL